MDPTTYVLLSAADLEPHLSRWLGGETGETNVAAASAEGIPAAQFLREQVTAILRGRALRLMNKGTRRELIDEAAIWQYALDSDAGDALRARDPELFGCWQGMTSLMHDAARRDGTASIEIVLRSHAKHAQPLLKLLAERRTPVPRKELREKLGIEEYQMSHLLSDLEEASLVRRVRQKGMKEVAIELDWAGREAINVPEIEETASLKEKVDQLTKQVIQLQADGDQRGKGIEAKFAEIMNVMRLISAQNPCDSAQLMVVGPPRSRTDTLREMAATEVLGTPAYMGPERFYTTESPPSIEKPTTDSALLIDETMLEIVVPQQQPAEPKSRQKRIPREYEKVQFDKLLQQSSSENTIATRYCTPLFDVAKMWYYGGNRETQGAVAPTVLKWDVSNNQGGDPWDRIELSCSVGQTVTAFLHKFTDSGAMVIVEPGLEAILLSKRLVDYSSKQLVNIGQPVEVKVRVIDKDRRKLIVELAKLSLNYHQDEIAPPITLPSLQGAKSNTPREKSAAEPAKRSKPSQSRG